MIARGLALGALALAFALPAQAQDEAESCAPADLAALAEWGGVWASEAMDAAGEGLSGHDGGSSVPLLGWTAPWNDAGRARMLGMARAIAAGTIRQEIWSFPMMMNSYAEFTFVISPSATVIVNQTREVRTIYTDGRGHLPDDVRWPTNWGDSIGCWEGDTLVVETVSARYDPVLSPFAPPFTEEAHYLERLRMVEPGRLQDTITITDPAVLSEPWTVELFYIPAGIDRLVQDAFVDRHDMVNGTIIDAPPAFEPVELPPSPELSEEEMDRLVGRYRLEGETAVLQVERRGGQMFFAMPPVQTESVPIYPESATRFASLLGVEFEFALAAEGRATGVSGTAINGSPITATRIAD